MTIEVQAPNGAIIEFPDGTDAATIDRVMREQFAPHSRPGPTGAVTSTTAAQQPPTPEMGEYDPVRSLRVGAQGVGRGLAGIAGFPGDVLDMAGGAVRHGIAGPIGMVAPETADTVRSVLGSIPNPLPGSDELRQGATGFVQQVFGPGAVIPSEEMTSGERIARSINEFGTEAMAGSGARFTPAADLPVGRAMFSRPSREAAESGAAGSTFVGDTLAGGGAGATLQAYDESGASEAVREHLGPTADVFGSILAALSGATTAGVAKSAVDRLAPAVADTAARKASDFGEMIGLGRFDGPRQEFIDPATGKPFDALTTRVATEFMQDPHGVNARGSTAQALDSAQAEMRDNLIVGAETPTVGQLVGGDNIRVPMLEHNQRLSNPAPFAERDQAREQGALNRVRGIAPGEPGAPDAGRAFTEGFEQRAGDRRRAAATEAADQTAAAEMRLDEAQRLRRSATDPLRERAAEGNVSAARERVNEDVTSELTEAQRQRSALYDEMGAKFGDEQVPLEMVRREIDDMLGKVGATGRPEDVLPSDLVARFADAESDSVSGLTNLLPTLRDMESAARTAGDFTKADNIARVRRAVRASVQAFGVASDKPELRDLSQRIQQFETEEFGPRFRTGEADRFRQDFNRDRDQQGRAAGSQTLKRFVTQGHPEKAEQLRRMMGQARLQEGGEDAIRTHLVADMVGSGAVRPDGTVNEAAARKWISRWGEDTLQAAAPGLVNDVEGMLANAKSLDEQGLRAVQSAKEEIARVRENLKLTNAEIDKGALGFALGKSPENAVASIMGSGDPERAMAAVVREIGDNQQLRDGLKQAVREHLLDRVTNMESGRIDGRPVSQAKLSNLLERHRGTLSQVFSEDEMSALQQTHLLLRNQGLVKNVQALSGSPTASRDRDSQRIHDQIEGFVKLKYGMLRGGGILRAMDVILRSVGGEQTKSVVDRMLTQAMLDPELAKMLMTKAIPERSPAWDRRLLSILAVESGFDETGE